MSRDNRLRGATKVKFGNIGFKRKDFISNRDQNDFYFVKIKNRSSFGLEVSGQKAKGNVDVEVFGLNGKKRKVLKAIGSQDFSELRKKDIRKNLKRVGRSRRKGKDNESLDLALDPGIYYIRVYQREGSTKYKLNLSTSVPKNPVGIRLNKAKNTSIDFSGDVINGFTGNSNSENLYSFKIDGSREFYLKLDGLSNNSAVQLIQDLNTNGIVDSGEVLDNRTSNGNDPILLSRELTPGNYTVRVFSSPENRNQSYELSLLTELVHADPIEIYSPPTSEDLVAKDDGSIIDIMIAYTSQARQKEGGISAINQLIQASVDEINQGYSNSGINPRLRLVHTTEVNYIESGEARTDLGFLRGKSDNKMDEIHALRDTYGADLVSLFIGTSDAGSIAYTMSGKPSASFAESAFSVVQTDMARNRKTLGHEIGHNFGAQHDKENAVRESYYPYGYGYTTASGSGTIMSYAYDRKNIYSSPNIVLNGEVFGNAATANTVRVFNDVALIAANWRASTIPLNNQLIVPTITISTTDANAAETTNNSNPGRFTLTRTGSTNNSLTVNYSVSGNATNGSDYGFLTGNATFARGATTANVVINPINDNAVEGNEIVTLSLNPSSTYTLGSTKTAALTIRDNDFAPSIDLIAEYLDVEESSANPGNNVTVKYRVKNAGTASASNIKLGFYLSTDTTITTSDKLLGYANINSLAANTTSNLRTQTLTLPPDNDSNAVFYGGNGNYRLGIIVDDGNTINESNEANNQNTGINRSYDNVNIIIDHFTDSGTALAGVVGVNSTHWGDYDSDGQLDLLLIGSMNNDVDNHDAKLYRNNQSNLTEVNSSIAGMRGDFAWGDYDNDGDLDLLASNSILDSKIYRNDNGQFININADLNSTIPPGRSYFINTSQVSWSDYDNDGDLDALIGDVNETKLFRNDNGTFVDSGNSLIAAGTGSHSWGDYDGDRDLDLLVVGSKSTLYTDGTEENEFVTRIYRNDNGVLVDSSIALPKTYGEGAWGDYDNDGDLDIILTGRPEDWHNSDSRTLIYRNNNGNFTDIGITLFSRDGFGGWADYDNDGDLDFLLTSGYSSGGSQPRLYRNDSGNFVRVFLQGLIKSDFNPDFPYSLSTSWGDYDNDGDLDLVSSGLKDGNYSTKLLDNNNTLANTSPIAPTGLLASTNGNSVTFNWQKSFDAQTPQNGLTYNLRIGTTPGGIDVMAPMSTATGRRQTPTMGNVNHNTSWVIRNLAPGTYYWSVQAVDTGYMGSAFAETRSFTIT